MSFARRKENRADPLPFEMRLTTAPVEMLLEVERVRHLRYMSEIRLWRTHIPVRMVGKK